MVRRPAVARPTMDEHDRGQATAVYRIPHRDAVGGQHLTGPAAEIIPCHEDSAFGPDAGVLMSASSQRRLRSANNRQAEVPPRSWTCKERLCQRRQFTAGVARWGRPWCSCRQAWTAVKVKSVSCSGCARTVPFSSVMLVGVPSRSLGCPGIGFCVPDPLPGAADASAERAVVGQARGQRGSRE